jgi:conjugative relaxase-like TrwC/TraI family protein
MGGGSKWYFSHISGQDEYYIRPGEEEPGQWTGEGATLLGLSGEVGRREFCRVFDGYSPSGEKTKLIQSAGRKDNPATKEGGHRPGWDYTFHAGKAHSILLALTKDEGERKALKDAFTRAVKETISDIERDTITRVGKGGRERVSAKVVAALFPHHTARGQDGQLPDMQEHVHATFFNVTVRVAGTKPDGTPAIKTTALETLPHKQMEKEYGAAMRERLNKNLRALGVDSFIEGDRVRVKGISRECEDYFSKRSATIKERAPEGDSIDKDRASLTTRDKKNEAHTRPVCQAHWEKELREKFQLTHMSLPSFRLRDASAEKEPDPYQGVTLPRPPKTPHITEPERSLDLEKRAAIEVAVKSLFQYRDAFSKGQLINALKKECALRGLREKDAFDAANEFISRSSTYTIRNNYGREVLTTHEGPRLRAEAREVRQREYKERLTPVRERVIDEIKGEYKGHTFITLTRDRTSAIDLEKETKMPAASIRTMLNEMEEKRFRKSKWTGEFIEVDKEKEARKRFSRRVVAEAKYISGQISLETKKKMTGDNLKPRSEMVHKFLWATAQISKSQMRHLDAELRHEKLKVTSKTVIIVNESMKSHPLFPIFQQEVEQRGGKIVHAGEMARERVIQALKAERELEKQLQEALTHEKDQKIKQSHGIKIPLKL